MTQQEVRVSDTHEEEPTKTPVFRVDHFSYTYPHAKKPVLSDISFTVEPGQILGITGESGSGKSTLLYALSGIIPHFQMQGTASGVIEFNGRDVSTTPIFELMNNIGMILQDPSTQTMGMNVENTITFGMENMRIERPAMEERLEAVLKRLHIGHLREQSTLSVSGGEGQATVIASRMAMMRPVMFFDEALSALDPAGQARIKGVIADLKKQGITMVIADSDANWLLDTADKVVVLNDGDMMYEGLPNTVKSDGKLRDAAGLLSLEYIPAIHERKDALDTSPIAEVSHVSFSYGSKKAIDNVSLSIPDKSVTALLGHNGSGKSTLGMLLAGLLKPQDGSIRVKRQNIASLPAKRAIEIVGYLFQNPSRMFGAKSVRDELLQQNDALAAEILQAFNLDSVAESSPWDLSAGQQQQLGLAIVTASGPEMMILDEPTSGLTRKDRGNLTDRIQQYRENGGTVVLITHDFEFAARTADTIAVLDHGRLIANGTASDVFKDEELFTKIGLPLPWK